MVGIERSVDGARFDETKDDDEESAGGVESGKTEDGDGSVDGGKPNEVEITVVVSSVRVGEEEALDGGTGDGSGIGLKVRILPPFPFPFPLPAPGVIEAGFAPCRPCRALASIVPGLAVWYIRLLRDFRKVIVI